MPGGVIEGGTWEHRKRAKEMLKTADTALEVTLASRGKHHVADFLPKARILLFRQSASQSPCPFLAPPVRHGRQPVSRILPR